MSSSLVTTLNLAVHYLFKITLRLLEFFLNAKTSLFIEDFLSRFLKDDVEMFSK